MWLRRAALAHLRVGTASLFRSLQHSRRIVNSVTRCATPVRYTSSTSFRPQLDSKPSKPIIDLEPAHRVLRETFGHKTFRPEQEEVIPRLLSEESMVISWPSQSGASICYLVPAVLESTTVNHGITIVICVNRAFLRHRVETLREAGIPVDAVCPAEPNDTRSFKWVRNIVLGRVSAGKTRILYLYARYSADKDVLEALESAPGGVHRVVVEDASHFTTLETQASLSMKFELDIIRRLIRRTGPKSVVVAANSCHPDVVEDIRRNFDLPDCSTHSIPILPQPNLELHAHASADQAASGRYLLELMKRRPGPTVIYTTIGKMASDVAAYLKRAGLSAQAITGGLAADESKEILSRFKASEFDILCTVSGAARLIGHPHIRNVVTAAIPSSVSTLYRGMRVAGRGGGWSKAFLILDTVGMNQAETGKRALLPCRRDIRALLNEIFFTDSTKQTIYLDKHKVARELDLRFGQIDYLIEGLRDPLGLISPGEHEFAGCRYAYRRREFDLKKSASSIDKAIVANSIKSGDWYDLHFQGARGQFEGPDRSKVITRLNELSGLGHVRVRMFDRLMELRILKRPSRDSGPGSIRAVEDWLYAHIQRDLEVWKQCRREIVELFTKDRCTSVGLAEHFGTELPGGRTRCERCDWCLTGKPLVLPAGIKEDKVDPRLVKAVLKAVSDRDHPRFLARFAHGTDSPRVHGRGPLHSPVFRSMRHVNFDALVAVFAKECGVPDDEVDEWL